MGTPEGIFVQACILRSISASEGEGVTYTTKFMPGRILEPVAFSSRANPMGGKDLGYRHLSL